MPSSKMFIVASVFALSSLTACAQEGRGQGGERRPPPEAFEACEGQSEGDSVSVETRRGDSMSATCQMIDDTLVAVPDKDKRD
ncbi:MAG: hypothetical protein CL579_06130 [Alteromonadaceae bacterium]|nr:hypothetical protein [Alteromonadaceae bacterium]MBB19904.1 hypothetical protein [Rickettsiales bacterium]